MQNRKIENSLFKLMAYKDEYEVARLHTQPGFRKELSERFEGNFKITYHFAPPLFSARKDNRGRPVKRSFGPWMNTVLRLLAPMKILRGTLFDPFDYTAERQMEIELISWYENCLAQVSKLYRPDNKVLCE